jgi:hypothetical protein
MSTVRTDGKSRSRGSRADRACNGASPEKGLRVNLKEVSGFQQGRKRGPSWRWSTKSGLARSVPTQTLREALAHGSRGRRHGRPATHGRIVGRSHATAGRARRLTDTDGWGQDGLVCPRDARASAEFFVLVPAGWATPLEGDRRVGAPDARQAPPELGADQRVIRICLWRDSRATNT